MATQFGVVAAKFRRKGSGQTTTIDGVPVRLLPGLPRYVDGAKATDGDGLSYDSAHNTLQLAVTAADRDDSIYVRPKAVGNFYTENVVIPSATKAGLKIIGSTNSKGNSVYQACTFRGVVAVDSAIIEARSSFLNVENLHFWSRAAQTHGFAIIGRWNTGSGLNIGSSLVNCSFAQDVDDAEAAAGVVQSAVRLDSTEGWLIEDCFFQDCRVGISLASTASACYSIVIHHNHFGGLASKIAADLMISDSYRTMITDNHFAHAKPSNNAGSMNEYVFVIGGTTTTGYFGGNHQGAADVASATNNNLGSLVLGGNWGSGGPWTS